MSIEASTTQLRHKLRKTFRELRKELSAQEQKHAAHKLIEKCEHVKLFTEAKRVALYKTNDGELNTQALIEHLWGKDIKVYLPVLHPFCQGHLLFIEYRKDSAMKTNGFGIVEPKLNCLDICPLKELDFLFTPLVAFDEKGNRLGMGGGFFDRTLVQLQDIEVNMRPRVIGLAHDIQKTKSLPIEAWDIPLPYIITPTTIHTFDAAAPLTTSST